MDSTLTARFLRHDDITYPSIAKAFDLPLKIHDETVERMKKMSIPKPSSPVVPWDVPSPALTARLRMAELPFGTGVSVLFVSPDLWVPVWLVTRDYRFLDSEDLILE